MDYYNPIVDYIRYPMFDNCFGDRVYIPRDRLLSDDYWEDFFDEDW